MSQATNCSALAAKTWAFLCPTCRQALSVTAENAALVCNSCDRAFSQTDAGYWDLLPESRRAHHAGFLRSYETIRQAEKRDIFGPKEIMALPFAGYPAELAAEWRIRAKSFSTMVSALDLKELGKKRIIDLGCGNGWLSYRLAKMGHAVCALDINVSDGDGLSAVAGLGEGILPVRAEFNHIPLQSGTVDVAIFNGCVHYASDLQATLAEALRVLASDGVMIIMDSPIYRSAAAGEAMASALRKSFRDVHDAELDDSSHIHYLTWQRLDEVSRSLNIRWQILKPWYGWRWASRGLLERLRGRREPATFAILLATRIGV